MSVQLITANAAGVYNMDGKSYSLDSLMATLALQRADAYAQQIVSLANDMKVRNERTKTLAGILAEIKAMPKDSLYDANKRTVVDPKTQKTVSVKDFLISEGMGMLESDKRLNSDWIWGYADGVEFTEAAEKIKALMEALNSTNAADMVSLQALASKKDNADNLASQIAKKLAEVMGSIINKI